MRERRVARTLRRQKRRHNRKSRRQIRGSVAFNRVLRFTLAPLLTKRFNVHAENIEVVKHLPPPYVVIPNHPSVWDPFMVNAFVPGPIHYVVSDAQFRSRVMDFALSLVGSIPKTKVMSDLETVKNIMRVKDRGGIIGIFPEGQNTWDGHTLPLLYSTAKLLKILKAPIVTARITGAFLTKPRWSKKPRRGKVVVRFELAFRPEELKRATPEEIHAKLERNLANNDFEHNREKRVAFRGSDRAEWLERSLFVCPACRAMSTLRSSGTLFSCERCGFQVEYDRYGLFRSRHGELVFDNMRDWNLWQMQHLRTVVAEHRTSESDEPILVEPEVHIATGYKSHQLSPYGSGRLELYGDRMVFTHADGQREGFYPEDIAGANVQNGERLEFYVGDSLYQIQSAEKRGSMYKWALAIAEIAQIFRQPEQIVE